MGVLTADIDFSMRGGFSCLLHHDSHFLLLDLNLFRHHRPPYSLPSHRDLAYSQYQCFTLGLRLERSHSQDLSSVLPAPCPHHLVILRAQAPLGTPSPTGPGLKQAQAWQRVLQREQALRSSQGMSPRRGRQARFRAFSCKLPHTCY